MRCLLSEPSVKIFGILILVVFVLILAPKIYGQILTDGSITATIKISICGNSIIEGGEDCEGVDLNNQTCNSLGYGPGTLSCDIACSFDTSSCGPAPTSTPIPTSTPSPTPTTTPTPPTPSLTMTPTLTPTSDSVTSTVDNPTSTPGPKVAPVVVITSTPIPVPILNPLTIFLEQTGLLEALNIPQKENNVETIKEDEVYQVVKGWVEEWKSYLAEESFYQEGKSAQDKKTLVSQDINEQRKCDINKDKTCNLADLSILLYYVGR